MKTSINPFGSGFISILFLLTGWGCTNEFLDVKPEGTLQPDYYSSSEEAAEELLNGVYNKLLDWDLHTFSWIGVSSITSDDADKGSITSDTGTDKALLDSWTFGTDAISFNEIWVANYQGIARSNQALSILPELTIDDDLKNRLMGEARFLRAYFYWNLVRSFGGVPLVDYIPDPSNEEDVIKGRTRATADEIYNLIISDLQFGIENLPAKSEQSSDDLGRATSGAAKTFLAKVYLYQENWDQVKTLTDEIIASGEYGLVDDFATIWREAGENSVESIFEVQARGVSPETAIQQYTEVQGVRDQFGWGFNTPSQDLLTAFEEAGDEVRKNATIIFTGETMWDGVKINDARPTFPTMYNEKAYVSRVAETWSGNNAQTNKNLRIFRYAEVLLLNAEASIHVGGDAATPLNQVRERVNLLPIPDPTIEDVWNERRLELAFEHDRIFDLRRQGRAGEVLRAHGKSYVDGKHDLFPVPANQILISGGQLEQNPGW
ncbi:MAG: RagB/SusD family nutrient uptake outer membrane protein [Mangrovibacterium sp.]